VNVAQKILSARTNLQAIACIKEFFLNPKQRAGASE